MEKKVAGILLECVQGDIAKQNDIIAVVNAANAQLLPGGGVAGAIHFAAGAGLAVECRKFAPIKPGEAVITKAHNLPNKFVIHCLGPVYGKDNPSDKLLANCYLNALKLTQKHKIESIAFCAISTGIFRFPKEAAANIAFKTIISQLSDASHLKKIRFVLHTNKDLTIHEKVLAELIS
ncbi:MAG: macro domain-containing protein [Candidatus Omnitrophota bacterium]